MAVKRHFPAALTKLCKSGICRSVVALGFYLECIFALEFLKGFNLFFLILRIFYPKYQLWRQKEYKLACPVGFEFSSFSGFFCPCVSNLLFSFIWFFIAFLKILFSTYVLWSAYSVKYHHLVLGIKFSFQLKHKKWTSIYTVVLNYTEISYFQKTELCATHGGLDL